MRLGYPDPMLDSNEVAELALVPHYSDDGVDLTLIRWILSLTPSERLEFWNSVSPTSRRSLR